jgi:structural maintenance of chromosome 2
MFQTFKLNVNNPHFLVMQGRITKVLNMKPMEMLKMLEEAIGTQMYQEKRAKALKNMEKKENNLTDIH